MVYSVVYNIESTVYSVQSVQSSTQCGGHTYTHNVAPAAFLQNDQFMILNLAISNGSNQKTHLTQSSTAHWP